MQPEVMLGRSQSVGDNPAPDRPETALLAKGAFGESRFQEKRDFSMV
ncbi:MAG: hypothetical protein MUE44_09650 [Oscillatoriaceae cyanobacterium Prado104]|nr:hypothetical protein [Oscillatoriaceae cyanobacterium Prado104]